MNHSGCLLSQMHVLFHCFVCLCICIFFNSFTLLCPYYVCSNAIITAEKHVVLYTNKSINDRVTHNEILFNVEVINLSFLPLRLLY